MSWEVLTMKSRISFFNAGIFKSMLRRFWPLWTIYFGIWFLCLPLPSLVSELQASKTVVNLELAKDAIDYYGYSAISGAIDMSVVSGAVMALLAAMAVYSFLYNSRSSGMIASAPVRREAVFCSAYLAGALPIVAANLLIAVLNGLFSQSGAAAYIAKSNAIFFAVNTIEYLVFFSIATFIAMLTANIVALPILYGIINFVFLGMEYVVKILYGLFVFGYGDYADCVLEFTCPVVYFYDNISFCTNQTARIWLSGWCALIGYLIVGIVLSVIALMLYRKRRMETAGDVIAVKSLRPVFKYCVTFCAAICFGLFFYVIIYSAFSGISASLLVLSLGLLIGAFIGYFASEMLLKKSFHVFKGQWKGYIIVAILCVVFAVVCVTEMLDLSSKLPEADDIRSITCSGEEAVYELNDRADIEKMLEINKAIIANRSEYADLEDTSDASIGYVTFRYTLRNGDTVSREYTILCDDNYKAYYEVLGSESIIKEHFTPSIAVTEQNVYDARLEFPTEAEYVQIQLTPEQAVDFYFNALMKDIENGAKKPTPPDWEDSDDDSYYEPAYIYIELVQAVDNKGETDSISDGLTIEIDSDCTECIKWIKDNFDIDIAF